MKFLVDSPLGGLAKWLRFCGFDAAYRSLSLKSLPALHPHTYILTLQKSFGKLKREDVLILAAGTPEAQVEEVLRRLKVSRRDLDPMSRCVRCNQPLAPVAREAALGRIPEHVFHTQKEFYECPACHRVYWAGSHISGITKRLSQVLSRKGKSRTAKPTRQQRSSP
jgi:uncharacterized protein with PIN domain